MILLYLNITDNLKKLIITQQIDLGRTRNNLQVRRARCKINKERNDMIFQKQKDLVQNRYCVFIQRLIY